MRKFKKRTLKKVTTTRGGFTSRSGGRISTIITPKNADKVVEKVILKGTAKIKNRGFAVSGILKALGNADIGVRIGNTRYYQLHGRPATGQDDNGSVPASDSTAIKGFSDPSNVIGKTYKTTFEVGQPSTKTVNQIGKQNGTRKITLTDTMVSASTPLLLSLNTDTGFNQRSITAYREHAYWTYDNLFTLSGVASYAQDPNTVQKAYWLSKYFGTTTTILNRNKYLKMKVKVIWVSQKNLNINAIDAYNKTFNADIGIQDMGAIPRELQLRNPGLATYNTQAWLDPKLGRLTGSDDFNNAFEIEKTFTRMLEPGEVWTIDYKHHTGPGLDLKHLIAAKNDTGVVTVSASPFLYPIIQIEGKQVACIDSSNNGIQYIGTSPGSILVHFKKYAELVTASKSNPYESITPGLVHDDWAYRVFTKPEPARGDGVLRRTNVNYENILRTGETDAPGKYYIPVTTELGLRRGGKEAFPT